MGKLKSNRPDRMKQLKKTGTRPFASIPVVAKGGLLLFGMCGLLFAQSADIFEPKPPSTEAEQAAGSKKDLPPPGPVDSQPSRFAGKDIEPYVAARAAVFSMRNRPTDPFGLYQDPNIKPVVKQVAASLPSKRQAALPPTPLADVVKLIRVTTIMPGEKKFLIGPRTFKEGDEFPLVFRGKTMKMKVITVTANRILFRDLGKNEDAALETGILPPGMVPGGTDMTPPGMVSPEENAPLRLESGTSSPDE